MKGERGYAWTYYLYIIVTKARIEVGSITTITGREWSQLKNAQNLAGEEEKLWTTITNIAVARQLPFKDKCRCKGTYHSRISAAAGQVPMQNKHRCRTGTVAIPMSKDECHSGVANDSFQSRGHNNNYNSWLSAEKETLAKNKPSKTAAKNQLGNTTSENMLCYIAVQYQRNSVMVTCEI